jgi:NADH:ubiquinone oxidoreductase subunit 6 (subunit J)
MSIAGIPVEFLFFALTLLGVALFHHYTLYVALTGMVVIAGLQAGLHRLQPRARHLAHEWVTLANLLGLLLGFAILSDHFRAQRGARAAAALPARRLEGRLRHAGAWCSCCPASWTTSPPP